MRDRRAGDTAQRQKSIQGTDWPARVVCVGDWRGYVSAVGAALSGVAGDGVVVGIRNAEAEVLGKRRTIDGLDR